MEMFKRLNVDPKNVTSIFGLLTVFLLVFEGMLGFWLFIAGDSSERIVAGLLMTTVLIVFLFLIFKLYQLGHNKLRPPGFPEGLTPAKKEVLPEDINKELVEKVAGVEGTFRINRPPESWYVKQVSMNELLMENLEIKDENMIDNLFGTVNKENRNISFFKSKKDISVIPIPGESKILGRNIPTAIESKVNTQLAIIPLERSDGPLFIEFPLVHNVLKFAHEVSHASAIKITHVNSGNIEKSFKEYVQVEMIQDLEDVEVDGELVEAIQVNINVIGIKGDLTDHLLLMRYPTYKSKDGKKMEEDLEILKSLVNSFEPQKIIDAKSKLAASREKADLIYEQFLADQGKDMFLIEFKLVMARLMGADMDDAEQRIKAIRNLKPFKSFAQKVNFEHELLDQLWDTLEAAEKGQSGDFKKALSEVIDDLNNNNNNNNNNDPAQIEAPE